jgi:DNA-directed RNA polymerase subunit M/transcription elongation factor TFIIS
MIFCKNCDNMLYMKVSGTALVNYCKCCDYVETEDYTTNAKEISTSSFVDDETNYYQYVTPYIEHDPSLPRTKEVACVNSKCSKKRPEVIIIKYDKSNMKYLYFCTECKHFWTTDNSDNPFMYK